MKNNATLPTRTVMRSEVRFMNHNSVRNSLKVETLGDLIEWDVFNNLGNMYNDIMKNDFFRIRPAVDNVIILDTDRKVLKRIKEKFPNKAVNLFFLYKQMSGDPPLTIDYLKSLMETCGYSRSAIYEHSVQMRYILEIGFESKQNPLSPTDLLGEIYAKLFNEEQK
jgi:hypothetical protein